MAVVVTEYLVKKSGRRLLIRWCEYFAHCPLGPPSQEDLLSFHRGVAANAKAKAIEALTQEGVRVVTLGSSSFTFLEVDGDGKPCVSQNKDLYETETLYVLTMDVPGFKRDEFTVTGMLTYASLGRKWRN